MKKYDENNTVCFFEKESYLLSNWSAHAVQIYGHIFPTADHAYHFKKYNDKYPETAKQILAARSPYQCKEIASQPEVKAKQRSDWDEVKVEVMIEIIKAKLQQHEDVRKALVATGNKEIIEDSPFDYFWGTGKDGTGQNELGKIWMALREEVK